MTAASNRVLICDDEVNLRRVMEAILKREGYEVKTAANGEEALKVLEQIEIHTVITDLRMPKLDGMALLQRVVEEHPDIPVIILTAHGSVDNAVAAVKLGAFDYVEKPFEQDQIRQLVKTALRTYELRSSEVRLSADSAARGRFGLVGSSPAMQQLYRVIEKVADTPSTVLITGESGTGKELIAKALHEQSSRKKEALIKVNCAAIPDTLIESELFGYERGAFTGAAHAKPGRFELADRGTLFLDEIGEIPTEMQVKLLRALQEGEFERVGGVRTLQVDVRLVTATNRDLVEEVEQGRFREDLFYRLNVVPIHVPPLRERMDDIPDLVEHILGKFRTKLGKQVQQLTPEAMEALKQHGWPGNVRELENVLERTLLFCSDDTVQVADLPMAGWSAEGPSAEQAPPAPSDGAVLQGETSLKEAVRAETDRLERNLIQAALKETGGNVTQAAKRLKISRKGLQNKMRDLGLRDEDKR